MGSYVRSLAICIYAATVSLHSATVLAQASNTPATHAYASSRPVSEHYIVVFKENVANPATEAQTLVRAVGGRLLHTYTNTIKGFAAQLPAAAVQALQNNPNVDFIEQDQTVKLNQTSPQNQTTWGLDRIDQVDRPLSTQYFFNYDGAGVHAFIIDSGIRADHSEFSGRVLSGYSSISDGNGTNDCNGHGTHVAGTVGGTTYGVAKGVSLIPVRVLDCTGSGAWSGVIAGIDWAAASTLRPAVANMSLGGGASAAVDAAVAAAVDKGVTMVVAAGNSNANACNYSPAREPKAITVGATTTDDVRASYSNFGTCVDIFGPGSNITSAWHTSATTINTISGTSMASPHVSGVAVLALAANRNATPASVATFLSTNATLNRVTSAGVGSPNKLVYSLAAGAPAEPLVQFVAVKSIVGSAAKSGSNWKASATVTVRDLSSGSVVAGATVHGSFSPGGSANCITTSIGACKLTSTAISRLSGSSVFTIEVVSGTNMSYDSTQNSAAQITILRP